MIPKWMIVVRAMSSEGWGRIEYQTNIRRLLDTDRSVRDYLEVQGKYRHLSAEQVAHIEAGIERQVAFIAGLATMRGAPRAHVANN